MMDRAGLVGADGPTHAGSFDLAYLGCLPGFVIMAAADEAELVHMVATAAAIDDRPSALRYPRGDGVGVERPASRHAAGNRPRPRHQARQYSGAAVARHAAGRMSRKPPRLWPRTAFQPRLPTHGLPSHSTPI